MVATRKFFEFAGTLCIPPPGIQHDLSEIQSSIDSIHKFGWRQSVGTGTDPADIWSDATTQIHPGLQMPAALHLTGGANDTLAGTGAQKIEITYIRGDAAGDWEEHVETIDMAGASNATATFTARACYRMEVLQWGATDQNVAEIEAKIGSVTVAVIDAGIGQTAMAWYVVPNNKTAYLLGWHASVGRQASSAWAEMHLMQRRHHPTGANGGVIKRRDIATTTGQGINDRRPVADIFNARDTIWIMAQEVSGTLAIAAGFDMITLDNIPV